MSFAVSSYAEICFIHHGFLNTPLACEPDYLRRVALVTNNEGVVHQVFFTNAWGEQFSTYDNLNTGSFNSPYRFNDNGARSTASNERCARSAELDEETGLVYYGARYYDNQLSVPAPRGEADAGWLSVDPLVMEGVLTCAMFCEEGSVLRLTVKQVPRISIELIYNDQVSLTLPFQSLVLGILGHLDLCIHRSGQLVVSDYLNL